MRLAWMVAVLAGCYHPNPPAGAPCGADRACPSGLHCVGDPGTCESADPGDAAPIDTMIDAACNGAVCSGNDLVGCGSTVTCDYGCVPNLPAHCAQLVPSNGLTPGLLTGAAGDVPSSDGWTFDTGTGEIKRGNIQLRPPGLGLIAGIRFTVVDGAGVFAAHSFTQGLNRTWSVAGTRPLTLFAQTTITIADQLDVGASLTSPGPGGSSANTAVTTTGCRGSAGRLLSVNNGEGGGGGGGVTAGGTGGPSSGGASQGIGGSMCAQPSTIPLRGGNGGGNGGAGTASTGGGGGGAVSLVAMGSITITIDGEVGAPGGGGTSGANADGGGGGGGGGAVLLEAPKVIVRGALTAGGGGGAAPTSVNGNNGVYGSTAAAAGGSYTGTGGTAKGGNGGANTPPGTGQNYFYDDGLGTVISRGGGGGGASGRIEIRGRTRDTSGSVQNPTATQNDVLLQ